MPGLTGIQLQELLAATGRRMSIVFVSGHADVPTSVKAMKAGAVDLLTKPVDVRDLIAAIQRAMTRDEHDRATEARLAEVRRRVGMLTAREVQVFARVVTGMLNKQIGGRARHRREDGQGPPGPGHGEDAGRIGRRAGPAGRRGRRDRTQDLIQLASQAKFFSTSVHPQRISGARSTGAWSVRTRGLRLSFGPGSSGRAQASTVQRKAVRNSAGSRISVDRRVPRLPVRAGGALIA